MADQPLRADIKAAADRMDTRFGAKREVRKLAGYLWDGERVDHMAAGTYGGGTGLVVLTGRRLLFVRDGWTSQATEDFPLDRVSSVQWSSGVMMGTLTVYASGNRAEIKNMSKQGGKTIADTIRDRLSRAARQAQSRPPEPASAPPAPAPVAPAPAVPAQDDVFEALEKLGRLRDAGVVTAEEFEAKKAELLGRI